MLNLERVPPHPHIAQDLPPEPRPPLRTNTRSRLHCGGVELPWDRKVRLTRRQYFRSDGACTKYRQEAPVLTGQFGEARRPIAPRRDGVSPVSFLSPAHTTQGELVHFHTVGPCLAVPMHRHNINPNPLCAASQLGRNHDDACGNTSVDTVSAGY